MTSTSLQPSAGDNAGRDAEWNGRKAALQDLAEAERRLAELPGTERWRAEIRALADRLREQRRLAAVFGAFSTGKSSLINALIGEPVLTVSPHPTTASITHIRQANDPVQGRAFVTAKTEQELWDDVRRAFAALHRSVPDLASAAAAARRLQLSDFAPGARQTVSFLRAFAAGFDEMQGRLGTTWAADPAELRRYTAEEAIACYIAQVELEHPSSVWWPGLVWVDTPGVDSIHRRHTDVAFDYMRQADAILFVLYFTHAMTRPEKDFLLQLAGVQDVTGVDKLFVVVNAVDLAKSDAERAAVRERVVHELRQVGIREPRVFEVSSQLALAAAEWERNPGDPRVAGWLRQRLRLAADQPVPDATTLREQSGIDALWRAVTTTIATSADALALSAARRLLRELGEACAERVEQLEIETGFDAAERARAAAARRQWIEAWSGRRDQVLAGMSDEERALQAEWNELAFHAGERIRFRLPELFREAFHPGRFRDASTARRRLGEAAADLAEMLSRQVELEGRTFMLRVQRQVDEALSRLDTQVKQVFHSTRAGLWCLALNTHSAAGETGEWSVRIDIPWEVMQPAFRYFANPKQFFEGDGQRRMFAELEPVLTARIREEVQRMCDGLRAQAAERFRETWVNRWDVAARELAAVAMNESGEDAAGLERWRAAADWLQSAGAAPSFTI